MANAFVHVELNTTDTDKAKAFYGKLFEWTLEDIPMGEGAYTMIKAGKGTGGGIMKQLIPGAPAAPVWQTDVFGLCGRRCGPEFWHVWNAVCGVALFAECPPFERAADRVNDCSVHRPAHGHHQGD